ncbi:DUF6177 family protein [Streptomyces sp. NPDC060064]|uniref:DUF6177 family protein n=1 Tax=Streptomyces sp. NPDC060064 TaxID=3347049 RepID=UPI00369E85E0
MPSSRNTSHIHVHTTGPGTGVVPAPRRLPGRSPEAAWLQLTGGPPAGWGTGEPVSLPSELTEAGRRPGMRRSLGSLLPSVHR